MKFDCNGSLVSDEVVRCKSIDYTLYVYREEMWTVQEMIECLSKLDGNLIIHSFHPSYCPRMKSPAMEISLSNNGRFK